MAQFKNTFKIKDGMSVNGDVIIDGNLEVTGSITATTPDVGDVSNKVATTEFVKESLNNFNLDAIDIATMASATSAQQAAAYALQALEYANDASVLVGMNEESAQYALDAKTYSEQVQAALEGGLSEIPYTANNPDSVSRPAENKLGDFINVLDFLTEEQRMNAYLRLGTIDMGPQLQKAINAANYGTLYWPSNQILASSQELIIRRPQIWQGGGRGNVRSPFGAEIRTGTELRTLGSGAAYKTVKTRIRYRSQPTDAQDPAISALVNVQANGFEIRDMTVKCNWDNVLIYQQPAIVDGVAQPVHLGDEWDVGIFVGCRLHVKIRNVAVLGCWREAAVWIDVTRDPTLSELFGWDGIQHYDDSPHGADGCTITELMTWGGKWGVKVKGAEPKPGLQSYGRDYKVSLSATFNSIPQIGDTITLGDATFAFTDTPTSDLEVLIGSTVNECVNNLHQSIREVLGTDVVADKFRLGSYVPDGAVLWVFRAETNTSDVRFDESFTASVSAGGRITLSSTVPVEGTDPAPYCDRTPDRPTAHLSIEDQRGGYGFSDFCIEHSQIHSSNHPTRYARQLMRSDKNWLIDTAGGSFYIDGLAGNGSRCIQGHRYINVRFDGRNDPFNTFIGRSHRDSFIECHWDSTGNTDFKNPADGTQPCYVGIGSDGKKVYNAKLGKYGPIVNIPGLTTRTRFYGRTSTPYPEFYNSWDYGSANMFDSSGRMEFQGSLRTGRISVDTSQTANGGSVMTLKGGSAGYSKLDFTNPLGYQGSITYRYGSGTFRLAAGGNKNTVLWSRVGTEAKQTMTPDATLVNGVVTDPGTGTIDSTGSLKLRAAVGELDIWGAANSMVRIRIDSSSKITVSPAEVRFYDGTLRMGTSSGPIIKSVTGSPENAISASPASIALSTDTGEIYRKASGTSSVGWSALVDKAVLSAQTGSSLIGHIATGAGAVLRNVRDVLRDRVSVVDFGAVLDGVTNNSAAVSAMATAYGFVRFPVGACALSTTTIDVPVHFEPGAYIVANAGATVTITASIESTRQWIFRGAGNYALGHDTNSGENSRQVHASWFGAIPSSGTNTDVTAYINNMFTAVGNLRESTVEFDVGSYHVSASMSVPRACRLRGAGTRRTIFDVHGDGYDVFKSIGDGVWFEGIQFETPSGAPQRTSGAHISIEHGECEIHNVWLGRSHQGIVVKGGNCRISDISATYDAYAGAGSSLISVRNNGCDIDNIMVGTSDVGPDAIVEVGAGASSNLGNYSVRNLSWVCPSIGVLINPSNILVLRGIVSGLRYAGLTGSNAPWVVKTTTTGTGGVEDLTISQITASSLATNGILFEQGSTGITEDISVSQTIIDGSTGIGISFRQTSGTLRDIRIAETVDVTERATPYEYNGSMSKIYVSPIANVATYPAVCYDATVADDSVFAINLRRTLFTGVVIVTVGSTDYGQYVIRAASSPTINAMSAPSANMAATVGVLAGTTAADNKATVSVDDQMIYVENRLGSTQRVCVVVLGGMS